MSKSYKHAGLTPELYQRLVNERAALKEAHSRDYKQYFQKVRQCSEVQARIIIKRLTVQSWNVRGYHPKLSID